MERESKTNWYYIYMWMSEWVYVILFEQQTWIQTLKAMKKHLHTHLTQCKFHTMIQFNKWNVCSILVAPSLALPISISFNNRIIMKEKEEEVETNGIFVFGMFSSLFLASNCIVSKIKETKCWDEYWIVSCICVCVLLLLLYPFLCLFRSSHWSFISSI